MRAVKRRAIETDTTITGVIEEALRTMVREPHDTDRPPLAITPYGKGGLRPGIDLDDSAALLELLDEHDDR